MKSEENVYAVCNQLIVKMLIKLHSTLFDHLWSLISVLVFNQLFYAQFERQLLQQEDLVFIYDIRACLCPPLSFRSIQGKCPRHF